MSSALLDSLLGTRSKVGVLRCLWAATGGLSGREIGRRTGLSHLIVHKALGELEALGVVERRLAPPAHQFRLDPARWLVSEVVAPLFEKEAGWLEQLLDAASRGLPKGSASLVLFGSAAGRGLGPDSDIDLLVLAETRADVGRIQEHFREAAARVLAVFGRVLAVIVMPAAEFRSRYRRRDPLAREIACSGRVVRGGLLTEVLGRP